MARSVGCRGRVVSTEGTKVTVEWIGGRRASVVRIAEAGPVDEQWLKAGRGIPASY